MRALAFAAVLVAVVGLIAGPALGAGISAYGGGVGGASPYDWDHPVKWDQLQWDPWAGHSTLDADGVHSFRADDFLCTQEGWITDIQFTGWSATGEAYITGFRITFWSDVPAQPGEMESEPGTLLYDQTFFNWKSEDTGDNYLYQINIPEDLWFTQYGTPARPITYWVGIQAVMVQDDYEDHWYWSYRDRFANNWGDDAAFWSEYFGYDPYWHAYWNTMDTAYAPELYYGWYPDDFLKSADMCFRLTGIPIPEPATLLLVGFGLLGLLIRRRR